MTVVERWPNSGGSTVQVEGAKKMSQQQIERCVFHAAQLFVG